MSGRPERRSGPAVGLRRWLGPSAVERPPLSLPGGVAATGGALLALGVAAVGFDRWGSTGSRAAPVLLSAALLVAGAAGSALAPVALRPAGVAASGIVAPALAFFVAAGDRFPSLAAVAVVSGLLLAALYLAGPWRGHTFHLAILVVAGWLSALSLTDAGLGSALGGGRLGSVGSYLSGAGAVSAAVGAAYLAAGHWLDREGLRGVATPFVAVGAVALSLGTVAALRDAGSLLAGVLLAAAGAAAAAVGASGGRRATTWAGLAVVGAGIVAASDPGGGMGRASAVTALVGVVLVAAAPRLARRFPPVPPDAAPPGSGPPV